MDVLSRLEIPIEDKVELMINLRTFLDPERYEENIKHPPSKKRE